MIRILLVLLLSFSNYGFAAQQSAEENQDASYSKVVTVHGMVCAFCASSLEKKFKEKSEVEKISVDLEKQKVKVKFKGNKSLDDEVLKEMISSSGFKVVSISSVSANEAKKLDARDKN